MTPKIVNPEEGMISAADFLKEVGGKTQEEVDRLVDDMRDLVEMRPVYLDIQDEDNKPVRLVLRAPRMKQYLRAIAQVVRIITCVKEADPTGFDKVMGIFNSEDRKDRIDEHGKKIPAKDISVNELFSMIDCLATALYRQPELVASAVACFLPDDWDEDRVLSLNPSDIIEIVKILAVLINVEKLMRSFQGARPLFAAVLKPRRNRTTPESS